MPDTTWTAYHLERLPSDRSNHMQLVDRGGGTTDIRSFPQRLVVGVDFGTTFSGVAYAWGGEGKTVVHFNDQELAVRSNPRRALGRMRYPDRARTVWNDAMGVDQDNDEERAAQIGLMANESRRVRKDMAAHEELEAPSSEQHHGEDTSLRFLCSHMREHEKAAPDPALFNCGASHCRARVRGATKLVSGLLAVPQILAIRDYAVAYKLAPRVERLWWSETNGAESIWVPSLVGNWPWLVKPSPQLFLLCVLGSTTATRLYAHLNRADQYQTWFVVLGMLSWPMIGLLLGLDLLAGSLCVMPWTIFGCLLLSDAVHVVLRTRSGSAAANAAFGKDMSSQTLEKNQMLDCVEQA